VSTRKKANGEGSVWVTQKNGKPYYTGAITVGVDRNGKLIRKTFSGYRKADVVRKMSAFKVDFQRGHLVAPNDLITIENYFYNWLFEVKKEQVGKRTFMGYIVIADRFIKNTTLGNVKLSELKPPILQKHYNALLQDGTLPTCIVRLNKYLNIAFKDALKQGYLADNPCNKVFLPKIEKKEKEKVFNEGESQKIMDSLSHETLDLVILTSLLTGMRKGEVLGLKWSCVEMDSKTIDVRASAGRYPNVTRDGIRFHTLEVGGLKTRSSLRKIPLPDKLCEALKIHKKNQALERLKVGKAYQDNGLVFATQNGGILSSTILRQHYIDFLNRIGVPYRPFHALRHTYATTLFNHNLPPKVVQELLGHATIDITLDTYTHLTQNRFEEVSHELNAIFL
jgi:integrase